MVGTYAQVNSEYELLEDNLNKIDQDQNLIEGNLDILEEELLKLTGNPGPEFSNRQDVLSKCVEVNSKVSGIEDELSKLVEKLNHDDENGAEIKPESLHLNTNTILNNYYETLTKLELMTMNIRVKLNSLNTRDQFN